MSRNPLYHFLKSFPHYAEAIGLKPEHDLNRNNQAYVRLPLRNDMDVSLGKLRLQNHHISIYQNEDQDNPWLSQYHHTAYFIDDFDNLYQSHVYFNEKETVIHSDFIRINQRDLAVLPSTHESISLQQLASAVTMPIMN